MLIQIIFYIFSFFGISLLIVYLYFRHKFLYWKKKNIPYEKPIFPFGYLRDVVFRKSHFLRIHESIYNKHPNEPYVGLFSFCWPNLLLKDAKIIKAVLTNNEQFSNRGMLNNAAVDPYTESILSLDGHDIKFKTIRAKLNETLTIGKIKAQMFGNMINTSNKLNDYLKKYSESGEEFDLRETCSKYALDVFGAAILGLNCKSFEDEFNPYKVIATETFAPKSYLNYTRVIMSLLAPKLVALLGFTFCEKKVIDFYTHVWQQMMLNRSMDNAQRSDFVDGLMELLWKPNEKVDETDRTKFTHAEIVASLIPTSAAGYESSASMLSFALYQLSMNAEIQEKARKDVQESVLRHGGFTYDAVLDMKYVGAVVDETMRMYPSIPILFRQNTQKCKLPYSDLVLEKGTRCLISVYATLHDPEIFPDPQKFNPERELSDEAKTLMALPFGLGQRFCPGKRFALIEGRVAISKVLSKYKINPSNNTPKEIIPEPGSISFLSRFPTWAVLEEL